MAKDPAFLFYPGDWLGGTMSFSRSHKGAYMDLLMAQFNQGHMALHDIQDILGLDFDSMWERKLKSKFKQDESGLFYSERLEVEQLKRSKFTKSRRDNLNKSEPDMDNHMAPHMEDENKDEDVNKNIKGEPEKSKRFKPPEELDVLHYFNELKENEKYQAIIYSSDQETQKFISHYKSNGWRVGKNKMVDWKATVRKWILRKTEQNNYSDGNNQKQAAGNNSKQTREQSFIKSSGEQDYTGIAATIKQRADNNGNKQS